MNKDMCVACDDGILNVRAGAIIMKDGKLLMVSNDRDYLYSVGGRVKFGETAEDNLVLPDTGNYQSGKYGLLRHSYLKEHRKILYSNYVMEGTLFEHLAEIDQACNERMAIIVHAMAKQEGVTEALKAADQMEWVRRMNCIRNRAEEIVLHELVYDQ